MKVCLIIPPSPFLLDERVFPHIGVLKVASVLEREGIKVDLLDLAGVENYEDVISVYQKNNDTPVFGITATTPQIPYAIKIADKLEGKTILGGTHISLMNAAQKKSSERAKRDIISLQEKFDVLVAGDGELAIFEALKADKGVIDADIRNGELFLTNEQFSNLPFPSRHLLDLDSYNYAIEGNKATSIIAQLGCPFKCTFCGGRNSPFLRNIRTRDINSVVSEIEFLYLTYGYTGFMFYDDELNVNKQWESLLNEIIKLQEKHAVEFRFRGFVKAEIFTEKQARLMYKAGFRWLLTGFESGDERILVNIEKIAKVEDNTRAVEIAKNAGLKVKALMSIGHAGESKKTIENTKNWLLKVKPDDFDCTIITVYPGSPYFDEAMNHGEHYTYVQPRTGDRLFQKALNYSKDPDYYKGDPDGGYVSYVWTDFITSEELVEERELLEREVRSELDIPFNPTGSSIKFEHSMGQGNISDSILRKSYE